MWEGDMGGWGHGGHNQLNTVASTWARDGWVKAGANELDRNLKL